jgi:hypothetical protein
MIVLFFHPQFEAFFDSEVSCETSAGAQQTGTSPLKKPVCGSKLLDRLEPNFRAANP